MAKQALQARLFLFVIFEKLIDVIMFLNGTHTTQQSFYFIGASKQNELTAPSRPIFVPHTSPSTT